VVKSNRNWILGSVLIWLIVIAAGWLVGIQPQLTAAAVAGVDASNISDQNQLAQLELARLKAQQENLPVLEAELAEGATSIPSRAYLEEYTAQLFGLAEANGLTVLSLDYANAALFTPTSSYAELVPVTVNLENFVSIPYTMTLSGPQAKLEAFLKNVQLGSRLTIVGSATLAQSPDPAVWGMDFSGTVFVLFGAEGNQENLPPTPKPTPTSTPTPQPTDTATPTPTETPVPSPTPTP
jgi:Tfp pilus assembly protein PilO